MVHVFNSLAYHFELKQDARIITASFAGKQAERGYYDQSMSFSVWKSSVTALVGQLWRKN